MQTIISIKVTFFDTVDIFLPNLRTDKMIGFLFERRKSWHVVLDSKALQEDALHMSHDG